MILKMSFRKESSVCIFFYVLCLEISISHSTKDLPTYFPRCYRDDSKFNNCLLKATDQVRQFMKKGVPELNIPSISPYKIPEIVLEQGTNAVNYKATMKDLEVTGLDTYEFSNAEMDFDTLTFQTALGIGEMTLNGELQIEGNILSLPLKGKGRFQAHIKNSNGTMRNVLEMVDKRGLKFLKTKTTDVKINVGEILGGKITGLFQENKELEEAANRVIHENLRELINQLKPAVEKVLTDIINNVIFNNINKVPFDKLYPLKSI